MDEINIPDVKILCCNYFRGIDFWEYNNVTRPYWRFYWNETPGAFLCCEGREIELSPDIFVLIPPYTNFSTYCTQRFTHLYLHFTAGEPFNLVKRRILSFDSAKTLRVDIDTIKKNLLRLKGSQYKESLLVYSLVYDALLQIADSDFSATHELDSRIKTALELMNQHFSKQLTNQDLCDDIHMSQNNFIRLFKKELGLAPQKYLKLIRFEKALYMLCYTNLKIDEIASMTGFSDRYHFSRAFKHQQQISPGAYRKQARQSLHE
jgi:AraC-like DNA-binding protein